MTLFEIVGTLLAGFNQFQRIILTIMSILGVTALGSVGFEPLYNIMATICKWDPMESNEYNAFIFFVKTIIIGVIIVFLGSGKVIEVFISIYSKFP